MASRSNRINKGTFKSEQRQLITRDSIDELINTFMTIPYKTDDPSSGQYLERCWYLFKLDYDIGQVANNDGSLCGHYPPTILIPEREVTEESRMESKRQTETAAEQRKREYILDINGGFQMSGEDAPSRQFSGWVHVDKTDGSLDSRSLEISARPDTREYGSYAVIDGNSNDMEILQNGGLPSGVSIHIN